VALRRQRQMCIRDRDNPLSCGARVWIETENDVTILGAAKYERRKSKD
jgi:hypothetical protein